MSAMGMPNSQHAAALRIIGATMSAPRSSACTGPTVVASSPVPSQALEITPVRTQRLSWMSCNRARSRPAYSSSLSSVDSAATIFARSGFCSMVARNARTTAGSAFHSTYSGGSNAGKRRMLSKANGYRRPGASGPEDLLEEPAARFLLGREGGGEVEGGAEAVVGIGLERPGKRFLKGRRNGGAELANRGG